MSLRFVTGTFLLSFFFTYRLTVSDFGDIIIIISIIILSPVTHFSPCYLSSSTNSYPHRSQLKFHSAALSALCVMLQVQLSFVLKVFLALPFKGQTAAVSAPNVNLNRMKFNLNWNFVFITQLTNFAIYVFLYYLFPCLLTTYPLLSKIQFNTIALCMH